MKNPIESLLEDDHESLDLLLTELEVELGKTDNARAFQLLDLFWARLAVHIRAENLHLFPALTGANPSLFTGNGNLPTSGEAKDRVAQLRADHEFFMKELALIIKAMREFAANNELPSLEETQDWRRSLTIIRRRLEAHNRMEEEQVYIWPALLFDEKTFATLLAGLRRELDNLPPRFGP